MEPSLQINAENRHNALAALATQVLEIMLLNTTVERWDGARCYYPNIVLNAQPLINLSRSDNKVEGIQVHLKQCHYNNQRLATTLTMTHHRTVTI